MIEFLKKHQKNIMTASAFVLLIICYAQQKELAKLRKETFVIKDVKADSIKGNKLVDSVLKAEGIR